MTDYYMQVHGEYGGTLGWSFGQHITSGASESALCAEWHNAWNTAWTSGAFGMDTLYPTATTINDVTVATLNGTMHEVSKSELALALPGISSSDTLPWQESVVVSWRGLAIQRYGRGRWYLPALAEDQVNGDIVITTAATRIKTAVQSVYTAMTTDGSTFFVVNKKPLKDGTPAFRKTVVTTPLVAQKPARQSRRVRKVPTSYV